MVMIGRRLGRADFNKAVKLLPRISKNNVALARLVLVEGVSYTVAGAEFDLTRSRAQQISKSVYDAFISAYSDCPEGFIKTEICVPNERSLAKVQRLAAEERSKFESTKK